MVQFFFFCAIVHFEVVLLRNKRLDNFFASLQQDQ